MKFNIACLDRAVCNGRCYVKFIVRYVFILLDVGFGDLRTKSSRPNIITYRYPLQSLNSKTCQNTGALPTECRNTLIFYTCNVLCVIVVDFLVFHSYDKTDLRSARTDCLRPVLLFASDNTAAAQ